MQEVLTLMSLSSYEDREQTAVKHKILERYLNGFAPIVGDWARDIAYVDCCAGPWKSSDPNLGDTSFGRAVGALRAAKQVLAQRGRTPTFRCLLIERNRNAFTELKRYCDTISDIEVTPREWNFTKHVSDIEKFVKERDNCFPFIFIDPKGWDPLEVDVIKPILRLQPGEVLINLMTSFITRFISVREKRFERLFKEDWSRLVALSGEEREEQIVASYASRVREAGNFSYVCTLPVMKPSQDAFQFHMIYATRHIKGVEVFKETEKQVIPFMQNIRAEAQERKRYVQTGQPALFDAKTLYKETRFTRFQTRSVETTKRELRAKLQQSKRVSYDDAWAAAMTHSAVLEDDLHSWLAEWKTAGLVEITNEQPRQKFPARGREQVIIWKGADA